jgi:hypothetical protein
MSRIDPADDCPGPAAPAPSIEFSRSLSGLLDPLAPPPPKIASSGSWPPVAWRRPMIRFERYASTIGARIGSSRLISSPV